MRKLQLAVDDPGIISDFRYWNGNDGLKYAGFQDLIRTATSNHLVAHKVYCPDFFREFWHTSMYNWLRMRYPQWIR